MSFTPLSGGADRSFELVRQSLLQSDGLPFADALTCGQIAEAFEAEVVSFNDLPKAPNDDKGIAYTMSATMWAMHSFVPDDTIKCVV